MEEGLPGKHMRAEIKEQPAVIKRILDEAEEEVREATGLLRGRFVYATGSGTSYHAALFFARVLTRLAGIRATAIQASELPHWMPNNLANTALVAFSQSGESKDVLVAVESFRGRGAPGPIIAITNNANSTLASISDVSLLLRAGEERAVAATKTYMAQLTLSLLMASSIEGSGEDMIEEIRQLPDAVRRTISISWPAVNDLAPEIRDKEVGFILGRGPNYPTAMEASLKLREAANLYYMGYAAREFLHGPIQLLSEKTPVLLIDPKMNKDVLERIGIYGSRVVGVGPNEELPTEEVSQEMTPLVMVIPFQILALEVSILRGLDPDRPEKLSKVVRE